MNELTRAYFTLIVVSFRACPYCSRPHIDRHADQKSSLWGLRASATARRPGCLVANPRHTNAAAARDPSELAWEMLRELAAFGRVVIDDDVQLDVVLEQCLQGAEDVGEAAGGV